VKFVHLVGFITNKFVTMHGHMNVKNRMVSVLFPISYDIFIFQRKISRK